MFRLTATTTALCALATMTWAQDLPFASGEDDRFSWQSYDDFAAATDLSGQDFELFGPWTGKDAALIDTVLAYFAAATGANADYASSGNFTQDLVVSLNAGAQPDVAVIAQPGLARDMAGRGFLAPLGDETQTWITENYANGQTWVDLATFEDDTGASNLYGIFYKVDVKSLVWYVPEQFEEAGYEVPTTMEGLKALTEQIVADGGTPWCIGLGSGDATGWPGTDWVEDMMLRVHPPEVYDQWVNHEIPFDDLKVLEAFEEYGWFARNNDFVVGTPNAVATTSFIDSPLGLFSFPPECYLHRQATFIPTFFPEGTELGRDVDVFYLPAYEGRDLGQPVLGAGTMFTITNDTPAARAFIEFLKTPIAHEIWMAQTGFLTPHLGVNPEAYANDTFRKLGDILTSATTFRFDASDMMPGEVGTTAFWGAMIDYTTGTSAGDAAAPVEERWSRID